MRQKLTSTLLWIADIPKRRFKLVWRWGQCLLFGGTNQWHVRC